jgi:hypothetical protein
VVGTKLGTVHARAVVGIGQSTESEGPLVSRRVFCYRQRNRLIVSVSAQDGAFFTNDEDLENSLYSSAIEYRWSGAPTGYSGE